MNEEDKERKNYPPKYGGSASHPTKMIEQTSSKMVWFVLMVSIVIVLVVACLLFF